MAEDLSPDEQKTVALITRLARERFAPRAEDVVGPPGLVFTSRDRH